MRVQTLHSVHLLGAVNGTFRFMIKFMIKIKIKVMIRFMVKIMIKFMVKFMIKTSLDYIETGPGIRPRPKASVEAGPGLESWPGQEWHEGPAAPTEAWGLGWIPALISR